MTYTPLHLHTCYSLLDGTIRPEELALYLKELGIQACACTDHGWCGGLIEFQKELSKQGIRSLKGTEAYVTDDPDGLSNKNKTRDNLHCVIIAKDNEGLRNIFRLTSEAALHNFYYKPRIYRPKLEQLSGHAIITTACLRGILTGKYLQWSRDKYGRVVEIKEAAHGGFYDILDDYLRWFGEDFYLEIQDWDDETNINSQYNSYLIDLGKKKGIPLVITSDCHYLKKGDHELHQIMMAMQFKITLEEYLSGDGLQYATHCYVQSPEEIIASAKRLGIEEAVSNTLAVAEKCNCKIEIGKYHMPSYKVEEAKDFKEWKEWKERRDED